MSEDSLVGSHHVFSRWFTKLNVPDRIFEGGQFLAWSTWLPILAERCLPEFDLLSVRILVDVDVNYAHFVRFERIVLPIGCVRDVFSVGDPEGSFAEIYALVELVFSMSRRTRIFGVIIVRMVLEDLLRPKKRLVSVSEIRDK